MGPIEGCGSELALRQQADALAAAGADALVLETLTDVAQARVAVRMAKSTGLPVVASFFFGDRGVTPEEAAYAMSGIGADMIGANCISISACADICRRLRSACDLPLWIKPGRVPEISPEEFASHVPALLETRATFIGGCCGTGPEFIRILRRERAQN
jgi:methionine synthase I (cobalamin-dependent)